MTTSLMNNDLTSFDADAIRLQLQKQSLHNDKLLEKINTLQNELSKQQIMQSTNSAIPSFSANSAKFEVLEENFESIFKNYKDTENIDTFEDEKDSAINLIITKLNKLSVNRKVVIIIFMERYLCSFNKFVQNYVFNSDTLHLFVRLPIHSRSELKLILKKLNNQSGIQITKSQRQFFFRNIPNSEFQAADKPFIPSVQDGFDKVCLYRINQGD